MIAPLVQHIGDRPARTRAPRSLARRSAQAIESAMLEVLENDEVASRPGLMQRIDPRVKLLTIVVFAVSATLLHSIAALLAMIAFVLVLAALSRLSVASFGRKTLATAGIFALLLAVPAATAWITPGRALVSLGPLSITAPGVYIATRMIARVVAGASIGLLVIWTTRWTEILAALTRMHFPDVIVATLAMTQKQIMSLLRTVENIHLARESRMLSAGTTSANREWVVGRIAFVANKSMKTADDVYDAMLARGFTGAMPSLARLRTAPLDWLWLACTLAVSAAVVLADRMLVLLR